MNRYPIFFNFLLLWALVGCGPPTDQISPTMRFTQAAGPTASEPPPPTAAPTPTHTNTPAPTPTPHTTISIWKVGSPHRDNAPAALIPADFTLMGREHGFRFVMETFPAKGFAQRFQDAIADHIEPDILVFDNYYIVIGGTTDVGVFAGIGTDSIVFVSESFASLSGVGGGWQVLIPTSANFQAVKALAVESAPCDPRLHLQTPRGINEFEVRQLASTVIENYRGSESGLDPFITERSIAAPTSIPAYGGGQVLETTVCAVLGTEKLLFVYAGVSFESQEYLGRQSFLLVFHREGAQWQLISISNDDPTLDEIFGSIPEITARLSCSSRDSLSGVEPAARLSPPDGRFPVGTGGNRFGYFEWDPSPSLNVVAEIVEFTGPGSSRLFFLPRSSSQDQPTSQISAGKLMSFRMTRQWRVWTISEDCSLAFSDVRSFFD